MKNNKLLAVFAWLLLIPMSIISLNNQLYYGRLKISLSLLDPVVYILLAAAISRGKKDTFTWIAIGSYAVLNLGTPMIVLIALMLVRMFVPKIKFAAKLWIIPALVYMIVNIDYFNIIINNFDYIFVGGNYIFILLNFGSHFLIYMILGNWLIQRGIDNSEANSAARVQASNREMDKQIAYYEDLYRQGAITEQEFTSKKEEIKNRFGG